MDRVFANRRGSVATKSAAPTSTHAEQGPEREHSGHARRCSGPGSAVPGETSTLVNRNVFIGSRRTSVRLEPAMWDALAEICRREDLSLHEVCALIDERRQASSLTAAIRVFILAYFRAAATEEGHANVGHGALYASRRRGRPSTRAVSARATRVAAGVKSAARSSR